MLFHLSYYLKNYLSFFNVIHYVSFRAIASLLSTLMFSLIFGNWFINKSKLFFRSKSREHAPERHKEKDDMPTMGGIFILMALVVNVMLWCNMCTMQVWIFLFCVVGFGAIGCWDDWLKITQRKGISASHKFYLQWLVAGITVCWWVIGTHAATTITFPFFKTLQPDIGWLFLLWAMYIIVGTSNAVNLTDGLDGLALGSLIPNFATFALICYVAGHAQFAAYLHIPAADSAELAVVAATLVGASLGFLWYNTYPAQIFMGDVGSLALGSGLALLALMAKEELLLVISGGLFVVETVSVMLQVASFKLTGRRLFKMAPIHHHFELLGWPEAKISTRFGIISLILCLVALITLKLR